MKPMRVLNCLRGLALGASLCVASVGFAHETHGQPQFGGLVQEAKTMQMELVLKPASVALHLSDHGKAVEIKGATAQLTLLDGARRQTVNLTVDGKKFQATGEFLAAPGTKVVAVVTLPGKPAETARFVMK